MALPTELYALNIGIIGMGEMGRMYATRLYAGGFKNIHVCDLPTKYEALRSELKDSGLTIHNNGHLVSRISDFIIYSVEAEFIEAVVREFGPSTKVGAIVSAQTSVKAPERAAFDKHLPQDVHIVSLHSLHGPSVSPEGQPLVLIKHRAPESALKTVEQIMSPLKSRYVHMTYEEHDEITANTQAVTHAAFLSMGTAWRCSEGFPWETSKYIGGIETVKINITLRIYAAKWHVYAGLAILNPAARKQINQYAQSCTQLYKLMVEEKEDELRDRINQAREYVFGSAASVSREATFVSDQVFNAFTVGRPPPSESEGGTGTAALSNSHLSLLAMVDCWKTLGIRPFEHLDLAATPVFRLWFGVVEYLFRDADRLERAIKAAARDKTHRSDDLEFVVAARGWSQCVKHGSFAWYRERFEEIAKFFEPRFADASKVNARMIKEVLADASKPR